jgi:hypothetical protein
MKVDREKLIEELQSVASGLSARELVEIQSTCFAFNCGMVFTYNDEVTCRRKTILDGVEGAVEAKSLLNMLTKLPDKMLTIRTEEQPEVAHTEDEPIPIKLVILGKRRKTTLSMTSEISLPIQYVKLPKKWHGLPAEFAGAIQMVRGCTADESSDFGLSCIHLTPEFIESCDRMQAARVKINIGLEESILVRKESINHIVPLAMTKWALSKTWIHFRNKDGLTVSCRRYSADDYRNLDDVYTKLDGSIVRLSDGLLDVGARASVLSSLDPEGNYLTVQIEAGKIKIDGSSIAGRYIEFASLQGYNGKNFKFRIPPDTLSYVIKEHKTVTIGPKRIMAKGSNFTYVASITPPE